jgi:hypothetical protein
MKRRFSSAMGSHPDITLKRDAIQTCMITCWTRNINKPPQQKGAKGMKLTIIMCLLGLLASLVTGCQTPGQTPEQRSTRQTDRQMEERLRSIEQMMGRMDNKLDEINRKLPNR